MSIFCGWVTGYSITAIASGGTVGLYNETYGYDSATGNLANKAGSTLTYNAQVTCSAGSRTIPHAVSAMNGNTYTYDCNGNQATRVIGADTFNLIYDAENRLFEVKKNSVRMITATLLQMTSCGVMCIQDWAASDALKPPLLSLPGRGLACLELLHAWSAQFAEALPCVLRAIIWA